MFLSIDVHAPAPLRANVQAQNMDEFYDAFDVKDGDGMWLAPDKRVNIW
jgi:Predicted metalloendopeptidase